MKQSQTTIAAINHQRAIRNISWLDCWLLHQSLKNLAIVERLFWQLGTHFSGPCRWGAVLRVWTVCQNKIKRPFVDRWPVERWPLVEKRYWYKGLYSSLMLKIHVYFCSWFLRLPVLLWLRKRHRLPSFFFFLEWFRKLKCDGMITIISISNDLI